jgi:hypothetical protein
MPMYYPDLESVQRTCEQMSKNSKGKEYKGIIPKNESELSQARIELGSYFRRVWNDKVAAIEVEKAVTKDNYDEKMKEAIFLTMFGL